MGLSKLFQLQVHDDYEENLVNTLQCMNRISNLFTQAEALDSNCSLKSLSNFQIIFQMCQD